MSAHNRAIRLDCVIFRLPDVQTGVTPQHHISAHCGNFSSRITAWKRGSLRKRNVPYFSPIRWTSSLKRGSLRNGL